MIRSLIFLILAVATFAGNPQAFAQENDPVLFQVAEYPVHVSEFKYIYEKTNGGDATYSKASVEEYLDLYTKFKLKVKEARVMGLDSVPALMSELAGYRQQLANNYLLDKEVTDKLLREAYDRQQKDVAISHILVKVPEDATDEQKAQALARIEAAQARLKNREDFAKVAASVSDDQGAKISGGYLGYLTALQMPDFYSLETAAYNTPKGQFSDIITSRLGYHIVKVDDVRPARGQVKAAHVLIRVKNSYDETQKKLAKKKIDSLHQALENGANFTELASAHSEDLATKGRGGLIGTFGINTYENALEEAAFGLQKDLTYSKPIRSSVGWHILYRFEKPQALEYDLAKGKLLNQVRRDERYQVAVDAVVKNIKAENNFRENQAILNQFAQSLDTDFFTGRWQKPTKGLNAELFRLQDRVYPLSDYVDYLLSNRSERMRKSRGNSPEAAARALYNQYLEKTVIKYEEDQLEQKYPEFKALMREYQEGILLFEATKILVWDRASEDTVGLKKFYEANKENYKWEERAKIERYTLNSKDEKALSLARKFAGRKSKDFVLTKVNKKQTILEVSEEVIKKTDDANWKVGSISDTEITDTGFSFVKVVGMIPSTVKSLDEAKGYIVADYQDHLEKEWVKTLQETYKTEVDQDVLNSLIQ